MPPEPPIAVQPNEGAPPVDAAPDGMGAPEIDPQAIAEAAGKGGATAFLDGFFGRRR